MSFAKTNAKHPKRGGWYHFTIDGKSVKYPSITNILGIIDKSRFLVPWAAKKCAAIACESPWLTVDEVYSQHRAEDLIAAGNRGKGVHNIAEKLLKGVAPDSEVYPDYVVPLREFMSEYKPTVIETEKVVRSDKYGIGGSLDWLVKVGKETWLVDIKTSKAIYNTFGLQLGFYEQALKEEGITVDKVLILHLKGDGKYSLVHTKGNMEIVNNLKQIYLWVENQ